MAQATLPAQEQRTFTTITIAPAVTQDVFFKQLHTQALQYPSKNNKELAFQTYIRILDIAPNYIPALNNLANCLLNNQGAPSKLTQEQRYIGATRLWRIAANRGDARAQCELGACYFKNQGVSSTLTPAERYSEAIRLWTLAAKQGYAMAQCNLGMCYFHNKGVPSNLSEAERYTKAVSLWDLAAKQGEVEAQCNLGTCYFNNQGVPSNLTQAERYAKAISFWSLAVTQGHAGARYNLGKRYLNNEGVPADLSPEQRYVKAVRLFRLAAEQGDPDAQSDLGTCYFHNKGVPLHLTPAERRAKAVHFWTLAADQGHAEAQYNLGRYYFNNEGVDSNLSQEKRDAETIRLLTLATNQGRSDAAWLLAQCFINGIGVSRNYDKALTLYEQALQKSDEKKLSLFYKMYKKRFLPQCSSFEKLAHHCFNTLVDRVNPEIHEKPAREKIAKDLIEATAIESCDIGDIDYATEPCPICQVNFEVNQKIMLLSNNAKSCFHVLCQNCLTQLRVSDLTFRCPLCREVPTVVSPITVMPPATQARRQQSVATRPTEATESKEAKAP